MPGSASVAWLWCYLCLRAAGCSPSSRPAGPISFMEIVGRAQSPCRHCCPDAVVKSHLFPGLPIIVSSINDHFMYHDFPFLWVKIFGWRLTPIPISAVPFLHGALLMLTMSFYFILFHATSLQEEEGRPCLHTEEGMAARKWLARLPPGRAVASLVSFSPDMGHEHSGIVSALLGEKKVEWNAVLFTQQTSNDIGFLYFCKFR